MSRRLQQYFFPARTAAQLAPSLPARNTEVHASEVQVLSDDGKVRGADEQDEDHDD
jgi:hypothetical protein